jgi:hypothetical protein
MALAVTIGNLVALYIPAPEGLGEAAIQTIGEAANQTIGGAAIETLGERES